ncbi:hypothetical protein Csa_017580 [Cucumis sativus]|uniref:Uncharacterized protein n=1 Tax=Cucumis sativus TaxID=3659 RepID=A0A0A0LDX1_CUCSA|nr:hypothetical protein Csa_017580 [Cucumis sativus]
MTTKPNHHGRHLTRSAGHIFISPPPSPKSYIFPFLTAESFCGFSDSIPQLFFFKGFLLFSSSFLFLLLLSTPFLFGIWILGLAIS